MYDKNRRNIIEPNNPETLPKIVLFGLTLGIILLLPKCFPKKKAQVSHIHNDINTTKVNIAPISNLKKIRELMKKPIQINPKREVETLYKGLDDFLKISFIMKNIIIIIRIYNVPDCK
tara:strand:- start:13 stop:366 length:354 start_codon:yes stop_codon:yes gene_type:complete